MEHWFCSGHHKDLRLIIIKKPWLLPNISGHRSLTCLLSHPSHSSLADVYLSLSHLCSFAYLKFLGRFYRSQGRQQVLVFSTGSLICIFASRLESAGERSQAQSLLRIRLDCQKSSSHSSGPGNCQFSKQCLSTVPVPQFSFVKSSVAMVGYKRSDKKMCMVCSMRTTDSERCMTTLNCHQQKK